MMDRPPQNVVTALAQLWTKVNALTDEADGYVNSTVNKIDLQTSAPITYDTGAQRIGLGYDTRTLGLTAAGLLTVTSEFDGYFNDGTAIMPSISFKLDKNTGFYRVGDDSIGISTGGSQRAQFDSTSMTLYGVNGIDFSPGSDTDVDLLTVGVTGTPKLWWDESEDNIEVTHKTNIVTTDSDSSAVSYPLRITHRII